MTIQDQIREARAEGAKLREEGHCLDTLPQDGSAHSCGIRAGWKRTNRLMEAFLVEAMDQTRTINV